MKDPRTQRRTVVWTQESSIRRERVGAFEVVPDEGVVVEPWTGQGRYNAVINDMRLCLRWMSSYGDAGRLLDGVQTVNIGGDA